MEVQATGLRKRPDDRLIPRTQDAIAGLKAIPDDRITDSLNGN